MGARVQCSQNLSLGKVTQIMPLRSHVRRILPMFLLTLAAPLSSLDGFAADQLTAEWRLEFVSDLNIPTGTPYESVGQAANASSGEPSDAQDPGSDGVLRGKASGAFGGISAIAFNPASATLYALSDSSTPTVFPFALTAVGGRLRLEPKSLIRFRGEDHHLGMGA